MCEKIVIEGSTTNCLDTSMSALNLQNKMNGLCKILGQTLNQPHMHKVPLLEILFIKILICEWTHRKHHTCRFATKLMKFRC